MESGTTLQPCFAALDLGSGTIKLNVFEKKAPLRYEALELFEINTELRRGLEPDMLLKPEPVQASLQAVQELKQRAQRFGVSFLPAYGTSALRRAHNAQVFLKPLSQQLGIPSRILTAPEEARLNLLGLQLRMRNMPQLLLMDPGGDTTDCVWGQDWRDAQSCSLPVGSVAMAERFGRGVDLTGDTSGLIVPVMDVLLNEVAAWTGAGALKEQKGIPAIRVTSPIENALVAISGRDRRAEGGLREFTLENLMQFTREVARMGHHERVRTMPGEADAKTDRIVFSALSWCVLLRWLGQERFLIEPWGIKLGGAAALNGEKAFEALHFHE